MGHGLGSKVVAVVRVIHTEPIDIFITLPTVIITFTLVVMIVIGGA